MRNESEIEIGKRFDKLEQLIDNLAQFCAKQFDRIDERFAAIDQRFGAIDARFDKVETRLERVEGKIDGITRRVDHEVDQRALLAGRISKFEETAHA